MAGKDDPKQRLTDLNTGEVSIVDEPANERDFNIVKRKGATTMTAITKAKYAEMKKNLDAATADMHEASEAAQKAVDDKAADAPEKMKAAVAAVGKFRELTKAFPPSPPKEDPAEPDADDAKAKKAAGEPGQAGPPVAKPPVESDPTEMAKAAAAMTATVKSAIVKALGGTADIESLETAAKATLSALHSANAEVAKSVVVAVMKELPGATSIPFPSKVPPTAVGNVDEGEKGEMFVKMKKSLTDLQEEVAQIKKSKNPSVSGGGGDNADGPDTKPVKKSMWSNLF